MRKVLIFTGVALIALAAAAVALAGSGSALVGEYAGVAGQTQQKVAVGTPAAVHAQGTLPFTGLDLALMTAGAMILVLFGLTLRRLGRKKT